MLSSNEPHDTGTYCYCWISSSMCPCANHSVTEILTHVQQLKPHTTVYKCIDCLNLSKWTLSALEGCHCIDFCKYIIYTVVSLCLLLDICWILTMCQRTVLYNNIDQTLPNKLDGPTHCNVGVTCVSNDHVFYTLL